MACKKIIGLDESKAKDLRDMINALSQGDILKGNYSIEITAPVNLRRQNSLWYGGQLAIIRYKDYIFTVEAIGDIRAYLYDTADETELVSMRGSGDNSAFFRKLYRYIKSDENLEQAMSGTSGKYRLLIENSNWWEVFVFDKEHKMFPKTWVACENEIFPAIIDTLRSMDEYLDDLD